MLKRRTILAILLITLLVPVSVYGAVTLKYFRVGQINDNSIHLEWETATEIDTALFILSRSDAQDGTYQQLQAVPAEGDAVTGKHYQFIDTSAQPGVTYWYKLEEQDVNGATNMAAGPISASIDSSSTNQESPTPEVTQPSATPEKQQDDNTPAASTPVATEHAPSPIATESTSQTTESASTPVVAQNVEKANPTSAEKPAAQSASGGSASASVPPPPANTASSHNTILLILGVAALAIAAVIGGFAVRIWRKS